MDVDFFIFNRNRIINYFCTDKTKSSCKRFKSVSNYKTKNTIIILSVLFLQIRINGNIFIVFSFRSNSKTTEIRFLKRFV